MSTIAADVDAERCLITAALLWPQAFLDVTAMLSPDDFFKPAHKHIWEAIEQVSPEIDPVTVATQLALNGHEGDEYSVTGMNRYFCDPNIPATTISHHRRYAKAIIDQAARRQLIHVIAENAAATGIDATAQREDLLSKIAQISTPDEIHMPMTAAELRASVDQTYDWLIPDFLERGDRFMLTGTEGAGKSMLLTQIAFMAAAGLHPWTREPIDPLRVLLVDLENGLRLVARRIAVMEHAVAVTASQGALRTPWDASRMLIEHRQTGIDLMSSADRNWLASRIAGGNVDMLVIGPAYRMAKGAAAKGDTGGEDQARSASAAIDDLRTHFNIAVLIETHAPHGNQTGGRDLRPFGSSVWLRWPEFGLGLRPLKDEGPGAYELDHWRGPRDVRKWPTSLYKDGKPWPWTARMN